MNITVLKDYFCKSILMKNNFHMKSIPIKFVIILAAIYAFPLHAQSTKYFFYVQFKNKNSTVYSLDNPSAYLSQRAIYRRKLYSIPIDSTDLPVNPNYVSAISNLGFKIHCSTKWLNGVTVLVKDSTLISKIRKLPYVKFVQYTGITNEDILASPRQQVSDQTNFDYGVAATQINQLNGSILHVNGFRGENIHIAILDAGFRNVDKNPAFDSLRLENRLLGTMDFVNPSSNIYTEDTHGAYVLSTMAANVPGKFLGTAPKASYLLIRTEAATGEYLCEPDFWVSGIEMADSAGIDLATTSLGYTEFDNSSMNYKYADLNGKTARASIAASLACKKGMILLNSAGNEGNKSWKYISVPSDAEGVITVGAVTANGTPTSFSSIGPTPDGRVKPELCAMGSGSALISTEGNPAAGSGTSYSCPILAGMTACYLQAARNKSKGLNLDDLKEILFRSGSQYFNPTPQMGYGIPDFEIAYEELKNIRNVNLNAKKSVKVLIKAENQILRVRLDEKEGLTSGIARLFTLTGQKIAEQSFNTSDIRLNIERLENGIYILQIDKK